MTGATAPVEISQHGSTILTFSNTYAGHQSMMEEDKQISRNNNRTTACRLHSGDDICGDDV